MHKIKIENRESKNALKTENKTVHNNMGSNTAHKKNPQVRYKKFTQRYWFDICSIYRNVKFSSMASFLRSDSYGDYINGTNNLQVSICKET